MLILPVEVRSTRNAFALDTSPRQKGTAALGVDVTVRQALPYSTDCADPRTPAAVQAPYADVLVVPHWHLIASDPCDGWELSHMNVESEPIETLSKSVPDPALPGATLLPFVPASLS